MSELALNEEFEPQLLEIMSLIDEVFHELGQPPILENPHFRIHEEWCSGGRDNSMLCLITPDNKDRLRLNLEITCFSLRLDLDWCNEFPEYSYEFIRDNRALVKEELMMIFGNPIVLTHKGNRTSFMMFRSDGSLYGVWKYDLGLSFSYLYRNSRTRLLKPFFS